MHAFDFEQEKFNVLSNLEPVLDKNWQKTLSDIITPLDESWQEIIMQSVIEPKGIRFNQVTKEFVCQEPKSLQEILSSTQITNKPLLEAVEDLLSILHSPPPPPHTHTQTAMTVFCLPTR